MRERAWHLVRVLSETSNSVASDTDETNRRLLESLAGRDAQLEERDAQLAERDATIEAHGARFKDLRAENEQLKADLALLSAQVKRLLANSGRNALLAEG